MTVAMREDESTSQTGLPTASSGNSTSNSHSNSNPSSNSETPNSSNLACESCRRRKAKCDRRIPTCSVCSKTGQSCTYPAGRLKSGPKIGSTQQGRRRARRNTFRKTNETNSHGSEDEYADEEFNPRPSKRRHLSSGTDNGKEAEPSALHPELPNYSHQEYTFGQGNAPLSPDTTEANESQSSNTGDGIPLSYILHPSHETNITTPTDDDVEDPSNTLDHPTGTSNILTDVCAALNITMETFRLLRNSYFANMTFASPFHLPSFNAKIRNIKSATCLKALTAGMFSFAARFESRPSKGNGPRDSNKYRAEIPTPAAFHALALDFIEDALNECGDETPSLSLLQALSFATFYQLSNGVRGKAWRYLGKCIRIAYEKNLHLIDSGAIDGKVPTTKAEMRRWCFDEERRRCWWYVWEMDVFASTIRRCPTAIDWTQNKTFLPVDDAYWFNHRYHPSCFLELKPANRWKALRESGNEGAQAWFIVVNSLMKDAQVLSNPESIVHPPSIVPRPSGSIHEGSTSFRRGSRVTEQENLTIIDHTLRCYLEALPETLQWQGEYLDFSGEDPTTGQDMRRLHNSRYEIYLMTQCTKFMIYNQYAFGKEASPRGQNHSWEIGSQGQLPDQQGLARYLEAAESILEITNSCSDNYIRYVKPFLASTIWLATAAQVVYKKFGPVDFNQDLMESKFDFLYMQCQRFAKFWDTPESLLQNLKSLRNHLDTPRARMRGFHNDSQMANECHKDVRIYGGLLGVRSQDEIGETHESQALISSPNQSLANHMNLTGHLTTAQPNPDALPMGTPYMEDSTLVSINEMLSLGRPELASHNNDSRMESTTQEFDMGMMGLPDNSGGTDPDGFWDGMELDFEAMETDRTFSLNGLLFDSYVK